ncbi:MAG: beta-galactosidase [Candidatus Omnitrophica bacterium]|nr:beta-galactosidase [Candidatus Omnitrophota bacterium]
MKALVVVIIAFFQSSALFAAPLQIGTTYSPKQSEYLEVDRKETYLAVIEMGFDVIRLGAYWDEIEREEGVYDFSRLEWQVKEARKRGIKVALTVGMKAPRWPEYFIPEWVLKKADLPRGSDVSKSEYLRQKTLQFIEETVNRYENDPAIHYWQVENEPLLRIGPGDWFIGKEFLTEEVALVRKLDSRKRPIILTVPTYPNKTLKFIMNLKNKYDSLEESLGVADIIGLNVYPAIGQKFWGINFYFHTKQKEREIYFGQILDKIKNKGKKAWVVELQAEPWEPGQLVYKGSERPPTGQPGMAEEYFNELEGLGVDTILLWGAEYWRFRELRHEDAEWMKAIKGILKKNKEKP